MGRFLNVVERFFKGADIRYQHIPDKPVLVLGMNGKNSALEMLVVEYEAEEQVAIYTKYPAKAPEDAFARVAEYLTRANWGLKNGNFEMDWSDGEVRYKTFIDIEGGSLTPKIVQNLFAANIMTADRYFPGLQKVIWGGTSPQAAIEEIENQ